MLEVFATERGRALVFTTKSDLCARDAPLLADVASRHRLRCHLTITTCDTALARLLEPMAPQPDLRLQAAAALVRAGLHVGIFASPVLPGLNDSLESLESVASGAAAIGAKWFGAQPLFLQPSARAVFLPFLARERPDLVPAYRRHFRHGAHLGGAFEADLRAKVQVLRERYGLLDRGRPDAETPAPDPQLWLFEPGPSAAAAPAYPPVSFTRNDGAS
jgi:DNA repair photolyase